MTLLDPLVFMPAAFLAGVLMFLAPCTLPIVPGYLAFIAGKQGRVMSNALAFVLGFSVVFILLGTFAGLFGALLAPWRDTLAQVAGVILIFFGLVMLGVRIPFLSGQKSVRLPAWLSVGHPASSALIGVLFAVGWSPCIGPILGTILLLASSSATALQGAMLLAVFSLGLGLPFLLTALLLDKAQSAFARFTRAANILSKVGGLVLVGLGLLMLTGRMGLLLVWGFDLLDPLYDQLLEYM